MSYPRATGIWQETLTMTQVNKLRGRCLFNVKKVQWSQIWAKFSSPTTALNIFRWNSSPKNFLCILYFLITQCLSVLIHKMGAIIPPLFLRDMTVIILPWEKGKGNHIRKYFGLEHIILSKWSIHNFEQGNISRLSWQQCFLRTFIFPE